MLPCGRAGRRLAAVGEVHVTARWEVVVEAVSTGIDVPGRVTAAGMVEVVEALGGEVGDDESPEAALTRLFSGMPEAELAQALLEQTLLQPPIPAGCEALVASMHDPATFPWRFHEVPSDRVGLWSAHRLLHGALPERFPAPTVVRVDLRVRSDDPTARGPGRRAAPRDRTGFAARLLGGRPGSHALAGHGGDIEWAFDALWAVEIEDVNDARRVSVWLVPDLVGGLDVGTAWGADA